jgi:hypothetical protein
VDVVEVDAVVGGNESHLNNKVLVVYLSTPFLRLKGGDGQATERWI